MTTLPKLGRLVSASDNKSAQLLGALIKLDDITAGSNPAHVQRDGRLISFFVRGNFYEVEAA